MEIRQVYKVEPEAKIYRPVDKRPEILNNPYCQTVKEFMTALIISGYSYEDNDELCTMAIQATDKLIEKVGEKL